MSALALLSAALLVRRVQPPSPYVERVGQYCTANKGEHNHSVFDGNVGRTACENECEKTQCSCFDVLATEQIHQWLCRVTISSSGGTGRGGV